MEKELIRKLIDNRLATHQWREFVLADLFYMGKYLKDSFDIYSIGKECLEHDFPDSDCESLVYNPLKRAVKKKTNYLLSHPFSIMGNEELKTFMGKQVSALKDTVKELYKKGEVWWEFEPDLTSPIKFKFTIRKAQKIVPRYTNEEETEYDGVGFLWNKIEGDNTYRYVDFVDNTGRYRFALSKVSEDQDKVMGHAIKDGKPVIFKSLPFIRLKADGLYQQIDLMGKMYSARYRQADTLLEDNADPVGVVTNASETDPEILREDIRRNKMVKVEGTGGFSYASKTLDYSSIEAFMKLLRSDMSDACGIVSREQELTYVTSGRAIDRLYVDMDSDAADMGDILREALKAFFHFVDQETGKDYERTFSVVFNTDKPTDEQQIISNINSSKDLLSERTLLAQHPWVEDVDKELAEKRKEKEANMKNLPPALQQTTNPDSGESTESENEDQEESE